MRNSLQNDWRGGPNEDSGNCLLNAREDCVSMRPALE
jgi:hypothetical protein